MHVSIGFHQHQTLRERWLYEGRLEVADRGLSNVSSKARAVSIAQASPYLHYPLKFLMPPTSSGIPTYNFTVARLSFDCHVTAICSAKNAEYVKKLGADEVVDYTTDDVLHKLSSTSKLTQPYDLIVDCVGGTDLLGSYVRL